MRVVGIPIGFYSTRSVRGFGLRPNAEGGIEKKRAYVRINSDGLRDREHSIKTRKQLRIAVLAILILSVFIPMKEAFWAVWKGTSGVRCISGKKVEVINLAFRATVRLRNC